MRTQAPAFLAAVAVGAFLSVGAGSAVAAPQEQGLSAPAPAAQAPAAPAPDAPAVDTPGAVTTTVCNTPVAAPANLPPPGSPPFVWILELCFDRQGGASTVESETYMYYIKFKPSEPSKGIFVPWDEAAEQATRVDFKTLWGTNFLEDLSIESKDYTFPNGVVGTLVTYRMEERERVKIVDYQGSKQIEAEQDRRAAA